MSEIDDPRVREVVEAAKAWRAGAWLSRDDLSCFSRDVQALVLAVDALEDVTAEEVDCVARAMRTRFPTPLEALIVERAARTIERQAAEIERLRGGGA